MAPVAVEYIILLGIYSNALMQCFFFCRLVYLFVITIWRRRNVHHDSAEDSSTDEGLYADLGNHDSNCYDVEQGVVSEVDGDGAGSGGADRCCICLEQMPDAAGGGMFPTLGVPSCLKQTTEEAGKTTCRRLKGCGHGFHAGCIDEWLKRSRTCPSCRTTVPMTAAMFLARARALLLTDDTDVIIRTVAFGMLLNTALGLLKEAMA